nr:MAG TPA: hypothetical protein [Bacteriophage sp.]
MKRWNGKYSLWAGAVALCRYGGSKVSGYHFRGIKKMVVNQGPRRGGRLDIPALPCFAPRQRKDER